MKNLIGFSFLLILLPPVHFSPWQSNLLISDDKSKAELTAINISNKSNYRWAKNVNNSAQNQANSTESQKVIGTTTSFKSTADRMISYRHQRHMWVTRDGSIHVLFNQGTNSSGSSLVLYSSFDNGKSWKWILSIPNTNSQSTADGFLYNQKLFIAYSSANGSILFLPITYDDVAKKWIFSTAINLYQDRNFIATNPTIAIDSKGRLWTSFVVQQTFTKNYSIRLFNSNDRGWTWNNTYVNFGAIDKSARKSARLVNLNDRIGIVYTNEDTFYWAYKINNSTLDIPWKTQAIFTYQPGSNNSLYSSHFSLVTDSLDNIHLTTHDLKRLIYIKFDRKKQSWQSPKTLFNDSMTSYTQASISTKDKLLISYNVQTQVGVVESDDYGESFKFVKLLSHPQKSDLPYYLVNFKDPRIIAPALIKDKLPLLQQFKINGAYSLISFNLKL